MERDVSFNGARATLHCVVRVKWLSRLDPTIDARRQLTLPTKYTHIPAADLDVALMLERGGDAVEPLRELARYVAFQVAYPKPHLLYDLLVSARQYGVYDHFIRPAKQLAELYMVQGAWNEPDRRKYSDDIRRALKQWRVLAAEGSGGRGVTDLFRKLLNSDVVKKLGWRVEVSRWAPYVHHCLFVSDSSRVRNRPGERFRFVVLDPDDPNTPWEQRLLDYMAANPQPKRQTQQEAFEKTVSQTSLPTLPYPELLLSRHFMTLAALDFGPGGSDAEPVMAGYAICSVRAADPEAIRSTHHKFVEPNLRRFVERMRAQARTDRTGDCGYDLFSIDAVHVSLPYRGRTANLAHVLFLLCVELARQSQRLLGFSLLIALSAAVQTRTILQQLGFAYHNRAQSLRWLTMAFKDFDSALRLKYVLAMQHQPFGTPEKRFKIGTELSVEPLLQELVAWIKQYNVSLTALLDVPGEYAQYEGDEARLLERLPRTIRMMEEAYDMLSASRETYDYEEAVRQVLSAVDTDDTFLFLDPDDAAPFARSDAFARRYRDGEMRVGVAATVKEDTRLAAPPVVPVVPREKEWEPGADDLALYELWLSLGLERPFMPPITRSWFELNEEEWVTEEASMLRETEYLSTLVQRAGRI